MSEPSNESLKLLLIRIREDSPKGHTLDTTAMRMQRSMFLEEIEDKYPPFRGVVQWISPTKEVVNVQA